MHRFRVVVSMTVLALVLAAGARAADTKAVVAEIEAHDKAFLAAYEKGETKKMKGEIAKAVALGEKNGLGADPVMADTYVLAAIFEVDGNDNAKAGVRDFVKALKLKPDVAIPKGMATSPVKAALKQARAELGETPKEGAAPAVAAKPAEAAKEQAAATPEPQEKAPNKADKAEKTEKDDKADKDNADKKDNKAEAAAQAKREQQEQQERDKQDKQQKAESDKQLADAKTRAEKLEKDKAEKDKLLADSKARAQQLEKDKADRERDRAETGKQLAAATARIQQLEKDKAEKDKQLAAATARIQQLEKDKADREHDRADKDKQLADLRAQERKEREALDQIGRDKQAADTQARDAENKRKQTQQERERLFAGPEMPSHLREALTCAVPDEATLRTDLFVHCVARPNVKARAIVFYYRTTGSGTSKYFSTPMERTAKGWYAAVVPGARVVGKVLQYYAEALDGREAVVANNGKESSPNILTLRPAVPRS